MTDLYVPYCQNKAKSEELLAVHRSYLTVSTVGIRIMSHCYLRGSQVYLELIFLFHHY